MQRRTDNFQLLDDRAGPAVRNDERQCILMLGANVNEMNGEPINIGHKLRQGIQFRLAFAPIVIRRPVVREFLNHRKRHAL